MPIGLILYFSLALGVSFMCSLLEAVILSVSPAYINILEKNRPRAGKILKNLKENIDRPLSAILTLNTVAHTIGAAGVGAEVLKAYNGYTALASAILTVLILVFSEIIPKSLGAGYWKKIAPMSGYTIFGLVKILKWPVIVLERISKLVAPKVEKVKVSREEIMATAEIGQHEGTLHSQETRAIQNILCLRNIRAKDVLTPRSVLMAFQRNKTIADVVKDHSPIRFSRIPVYGKNLDNISGFIHRYKVLQAYSEGLGHKKLHELAMPIHAVPNTKSVSGVLDEFIKRREQLFLVVDEYGGTAGIITLEDVIETLLGVEIVDEFDTVEDMRKYALSQWEKRKRKRKL
ncbi:MAG: hemolysin family protein [Phycisphaerae bacterium]|nr:hemolysin family protein [Phycisphaerae bacterium]